MKFLGKRKMDYIKNLSAILAVDSDNGIGLNNKLPWHYPEDLKWFKNNTLAKTIIMGKNTFDSILGYSNSKLLPHRKHIVLTSKSLDFPQVTVYHKFFDIIEEVKKNPHTEYVIIGGSQLYSLTLPLINTLYLTRINKSHNCDAFVDLEQYPFKLAHRYYCYIDAGIEYNIYKRS